MTAELLPELPLEASVQRAWTSLGRGELVAFRTDTLYGISCDPQNPSALDRLQQLKGRRDGRGFVSLCRGAASAAEFSGPLDQRIAMLMGNVWPGPVTLILPAGQEIPAAVAASDSSWAVRVPDSALCLRLLSEDFPWLPSTSANLPGEPPAGSAAELLRLLGNQLGLIIDSGRVAPGAAASVLADGRAFPPQVARAGGACAMARLQAAVEAASS